MVLAGIQKNDLDTGLRRYDARDSDAHLCGVVLGACCYRKIMRPLSFSVHKKSNEHAKC
jgi:hypothetical protein